MKLTPELSLFLTDLYNIAIEQPLNSFKQIAIERLDEFLPMDSGIWITVSEIESLHHHADTFTYKQPEGCMDNYIKLTQGSKEVQEMGHLLFENLNTTMDLDELTPGKEWHETDLYLRHAKKYNQVKSLITMVHNPINDMINTISISRGIENDNFTAEEKLIKQFITPHLMEAFRINILNSFSKNESNNKSLRAVVDKHGQFVEAEEGFIVLLNQFKLIDNNRVDLESIGLNKLESLQITVTRVQGEGLRYLEAIDLREKQPLTKRKKQIARLLARGLSNKEIAKELNVTADTIGKHLQEINKIFNVNSRYQAISYILRQPWYEVSRELSE